MYKFQKIFIYFLKKVNISCISHYLLSEYAMCVMVMECMLQYREMCYGISICNVCNGDAVSGTV